MWFSIVSFRPSKVVLGPPPIIHINQSYVDPLQVWPPGIIITSHNWQLHNVQSIPVENHCL